MIDFAFITSKFLGCFFFLQRYRKRHTPANIWDIMQVYVTNDMGNHQLFVQNVQFSPSMADGDMVGVEALLGRSCSGASRDAAACLEIGGLTG